MASEELQVSVSAGRSEGQRVLVCRGQMTMLALAPLREAVRGETSPVLILVLNEVSHMDSAGLGLLVQLQATCTRTGRRLVLAGVNERIRNTLTVSGLSQVLTVYSTRADAEQAMS